MMNLPQKFAAMNLPDTKSKHNLFGLYDLEEKIYKILVSEGCIPPATPTHFN